MDGAKLARPLKRTTNLCVCGVSCTLHATARRGGAVTTYTSTVYRAGFKVDRRLQVLLTRQHTRLTPRRDAREQMLAALASRAGTGREVLLL